MMGTDTLLWIGDPDHLFILLCYPFPDPPFVTRSFADPDPDTLFLTRSGSGSVSDRRSRITDQRSRSCLTLYIYVCVH